MKFSTVMVLITFCLVTDAQAKGCSAKAAEEAETAADNLQNWQAVGDYYKKYGRCDDASAGEGYSDGICRLLDQHWETLPELIPLIKANPGLEKFVAAGNNESCSGDGLVKGALLSGSQCPAGLTSLCRKIHAEDCRELKQPGWTRDALQKEWADSGQQGSFDYAQICK